MQRLRRLSQNRDGRGRTKTERPSLADCTPEHLLYLREIEESLPGALIIHIIRMDGMSLCRLTNSVGSEPFVDKKRKPDGCGTLLAMDGKEGREYGRIIGPRYMEVRYEDLVTEPRRIR